MAAGCPVSDIHLNWILRCTAVGQTSCRKMSFGDEKTKRIRNNAKGGNI